MADDGLFEILDDPFDGPPPKAWRRLSNLDLGRDLRCFYRRMYRDIRIRIPYFEPGHPETAGRFYRHEGQYYGMSRDQAKAFVWTTAMTHSEYL